VLGLVCLAWVLMDGPLADKGPGLRAWVLLLAAGIGAFSYSWYSVKIWVADSFYKQGQVGLNANQLGYAVAMYQKAAGQIDTPITEDQMNALYEAAVPSEAQRLQTTPGLNADQELYWVKLGIAFETAASEETDPGKKMSYFQTALAVHEVTLQMNPINGYNFNNKGRVLRTMGDSTGQEQYFQKALDHYNQAIALDPNNVYFNLDKITTLLGLKRPQEAFTLAVHLIKTFPDFAMPYSYAGFMKMQAGQENDAIHLLEKALSCDWKGDTGSEVLAAMNLGQIFEKQKQWAQAVQAYTVAATVNPQLPDAYQHLSTDELHLGQKAQAIANLRQWLKISPGQPLATAALKKLGATP
jgi:tetratricopeptide (TPR) repeat protein